MKTSKDRWEDIVKKARLDLSKPVSYVSAKKVKDFGKYEPRLLAKTDVESKLPRIFQDNHVFLLPTKRGEYVIVKGKGYHEPENIAGPRTHEATIPPELEYVLQRKQTESIALDYAYQTDLLKRFLSLKNMYQYIRGRIDTVPFTFKVDGSPPIRVDGAQVELDGSYIGNGDTVVVEAKIGTPPSFWVKQLYYPYRHLRIERPESKVRSLFFTYDKLTQVFSIREYEFADPENYESIQLVKGESYKIKVRPLEAEVLLKKSPDLTGKIPQADSFDKVMQFPVFVSLGRVDSKSMARALGFSERQSSYYRHACEMLGLVKMEDHRYQLTKLGEEYVKKTPSARTRMLSELLLRHPIMRDIYERVQGPTGKAVTRSDVVEIIKRSSTLSKKTPPRRSQTIFKWFEWLGHVTGTVKVSHDQISKPESTTLDSYA
jgi:hypothetical protein